MSNREWKKYAVGPSEKSGGSLNVDCRFFDTISHTSHAGLAMGIIANNEIRPSLIFDKSKLNKDRILVSWLSPNSWSGVGYRYGNVQFVFPFSGLIKGKQFYWVEAIDYKIPACRILITDQDRSNSLDVYDPRERSGPWWHDAATGRHYFNGNHCIEFMFESIIPLDDLTSITFVAHHNKYCSIHPNNPSKCSEFGVGREAGGAKFLANAVISGISIKEYERFFDDDDIAGALNRYTLDVTRNVSHVPDPPACNTQALSRAALAAYFYDRVDDAKGIASLFPDKRSFDDAVFALVEEALGRSVNR